MSTMRPMAHTASPIGTLTNITQRQDRNSVRKPPATRPVAPPAADTVVNRPMARTRCWPSGKTDVSSASEEGAASAAPTPCMARLASSIQLSAANPPTSELREKIAMPSRNVRRRPRRSPARAPSNKQPAEGEDVAVQHPGQAGAGEAQAPLDVRQGNVHNRGVEDDHELGCKNDEQEHRGVYKTTPDGSGPTFHKVADRGSSRLENGRGGH